MRRSGRKLGTLAVAAVAGFSLAAQPASASERFSVAAQPSTAAAAEDGGDEDAGPGRVVTSQEALAHDTAMIAEKNGWTLAEAESQVSLQERAGQIVSKLRSEFPTQFAEARMARTPGDPVTVTFTGQVPSEARDVVAPLGERIELIGDAELSELALQRRMDAVTDAMKTLGYTDFTTSGHPVSGNIDVLARVAASAPSTAADAVAHLPDAVRPHVRLDLRKERVSSEMHTYGGAWVGSYAAGRYCTSGFTVRHLTTGSTGLQRRGIAFQSTDIGSLGTIYVIHSTTKLSTLAPMATFDGRLLLRTVTTRNSILRATRGAK